MPIEVRTFNGKKYYVDSDTDDVLSEAKGVGISPDAKIGASSATSLGDKLSPSITPGTDPARQAKKIASAPIELATDMAISAIPPAAAIAGGSFGGPGGYLGGNLAGVIAQRQLQRLTGRNLSNPDDEIAGIGTDFFTNILMDAATAGTAKAGKLALKGVQLATSKKARTELKVSIAKNLLKGKTGVAPETIEFVKENPDFPITLGQLKGQDSTLDFAEKLLKPEQRRTIQAIQTDILSGKVTEGVASRTPNKIRIVNGRIQDRNSEFHATESGRFSSILEKGIVPRRQISTNEKTISTSREPGINLARGKGVTIEVEPTKGDPVAEYNFSKNSRQFESEQRTKEPIPKEKFKRIIINKEALQREREIEIAVNRGRTSVRVPTVEESMSKVIRQADENNIPVVVVNNEKELKNIRSMTAKLAPKEEIAGEVKRELQGGFEKARSFENRNFNASRAYADLVEVQVPRQRPPQMSSVVDANGNTVQLPAETFYETVKGPINLDKTREFVNQALRKIEKSYNVSNTEQLFPILSDEAKGMISIMQRVSAAEGPIPYTVALDLKRILGRKGFQNSIPNGIDEALAKKITGSLSEDIPASISSWQAPFNELALKTYNRGNAMSRKIGQNFKDISELENLRSNPLSGVGDVKRILTDPILIRKTVRSSANPTNTKKLLQAEFISDIQDRMTKDGVFKPNGEILERLFSDRDSAVMTELFPGNSGATVKKLFRTISDVSESVGNQGQQNLAMRETAAGISFGGSLLKAIQDGSVAPLISGGGKVLSAVLGGKYFLEKVALDPKIARAAIQLNQTPQNTPRAKALAKIVFGALRGTQIYLTTPDGTQPAVINEDGKVEMIAPE